MASGPISSSDDSRDGDTPPVDPTLAVLARMRQRAHDWEAAIRTAFEEAGGQCWVCRDTGWVTDRYGDPTEIACTACGLGERATAALRLKQIRGLLEASSMSPRVLELTWASFPHQRNKALRELQAFLLRWDDEEATRQPHGSLMLLGAYGVGKTGLLAGLVRQVAESATYHGHAHNTDIMWTTGVDLMEAMRPTPEAGPGGQTGAQRATWERARTCDVLAIDDLGAEKPSEWVVERLFGIINERYERLRPVFLTSNYGLADLAARIGERTLDRLAEMARDAVIEVKGPNLRHIARRGQAAGGDA